MANLGTKIRDHKSEKALFFRRAVYGFLGVILLSGILLINLYILQVQEYKLYKTRSNENRIQVVSIPPVRGQIYDRNGVLLAKNEPVYDLEIIPSQVKNLDQTISSLKNLIDISDYEIKSFRKKLKYNAPFKAISLKSQLTPKQVAIIAVNQYQYPGVHVISSLKREYPFKEALTHTLGYVGRVNDRDIQRLKKEGKYNDYLSTKYIGRIGIEKYYEPLLHGKSGFKEVEVNSHGKVIRTISILPATPGKDIYLSIDIKLELYIEKVLADHNSQKSLQDDDKHITTRGAVVVLDPRNNEVLAMVSSPSYDPNLFVDGISHKNYNSLLKDPGNPLYNRATLGAYSPGSTSKPFSSIALLGTNTITLNSKIPGPKRWRIPGTKGRYFNQTDHGMGLINIETAIEKSSDTFFYQLVYKLGITKFSKWMTKFGFGQPTGIDIGEESNGIMPTRLWKRENKKQPWYDGDTISVAIGQGYWTSTPLQLALATSILINDGIKYTPHLLKYILNNNKIDKISPQHTKVVANIPDIYWNAVKKSMLLVSQYGTGKSIFGKKNPYLVGSKTGTAQVFSLKKNQKYDATKLAKHLHDNSLFIAFAPYNSPKYVISTIIENGGFGAAAAGPITKKILDYLILKKDNETSNDKK